MAIQSTKTEILASLRARLALDGGLGIEYLSGNGRELAELEEAVAGAKRNIPAPASVSTEPAKAAAAPLPAAPSPVRPEIPRSAVSPAPAAARQAPAPPPSVRSRFSLVPLVEAPVNPEKEAALAPLRQEAMGCRDCELCAKRNSVVWGEGNLDTPVLFIGEAPGQDEDLEGRPFVGRSGRLLTDIIEKGMKMPRQTVYIANVVKCRPPGNRDPKPEEVSACYRFLRKQIEVIAPKVIVAVGGVAGCFLLDLPPKSPGLRGRWHQYGGIPLRVVFHPSYLLRQRGANAAGGSTSADKETWKDVQEIMRRLEEA